MNIQEIFELSKTLSIDDVETLIIKLKFYATREKTKGYYNPAPPGSGFAYLEDADGDISPAAASSSSGSISLEEENIKADPALERFAESMTAIESNDTLVYSLSTYDIEEGGMWPRRRSIFNKDTFPILTKNVYVKDSVLHVIIPGKTAESAKTLTFALMDGCLIYHDDLGHATVEKMEGDGKDEGAWMYCEQRFRRPDFPREIKLQRHKSRLPPILDLQNLILSHMSRSESITIHEILEKLPYSNVDKEIVACFHGILQSQLTSGTNVAGKDSTDYFLTKKGARHIRDAVKTSFVSGVKLGMFVNLGEDEHIKNAMDLRLEELLHSREGTKRVLTVFRDKIVKKTKTNFMF